ncbi:hypothetical protein ANN_23661 [Periplaneta americana]|uniref:Reverse transcriptase domain-containing protein n=1 Tax=Periplaneta americana TaxID=6978 RepID=A0ABQ8SLP1_PERAM|nr:hypothetical protein ANN_23661 [Periplaneta americana]
MHDIVQKRLKLHPATSSLIHSTRDTDVRDQRTRLFSVDEIGDSEMIFGEMRPRFRQRLPCIHMTVRENLGKPNQHYHIGTSRLNIDRRKMSEGTEIRRGVRQGCPLSPTCSNTYLEDLVKNCFQNMRGVIVEGRIMKCVRFADDKTLLADEMMLRDMLLELNDSCEQYGMEINANKTKTMVIGRKVKKLRDCTVGYILDCGYNIKVNPTVIMHHSEQFWTFLFLDILLTGHLFPRTFVLGHFTLDSFVYDIFSSGRFGTDILTWKRPESH